jgi:hypothetical protein
MSMSLQSAASRRRPLRCLAFSLGGPLLVRPPRSPEQLISHIAEAESQAVGYLLSTGRYLYQEGHDADPQ